MNMVVGVTRSMSFVILALLRGTFSGYSIPYTVFAFISLVGVALIAMVKVVGAVGKVSGVEVVNR